MIQISVGNLWRMKLRAFLTITGVVIAIAAFVSMLSFAAGMEENVSKQFDSLGLLSSIQVYPQRQSDDDTTTAPPLDASAIDSLLNIPGVKLVYPYDAFDVEVEYADTQLSRRAQVLTEEAATTRLFSQFLAGETFTSDSARKAIITDAFLEELGIEDPDSAIGARLILSVGVASLDSALAHLITSDGESIKERLKRIDIDSLLRNSEYQKRVFQAELSEAARRFLEGYLDARGKNFDTLTISGVIKGTQGRSRSAPILVPLATQKALFSGGFTGDPLDLFGSIMSGTLFEADNVAGGKGYSQVTVEIEPTAPYRPVKDSITALGFRSFSYAEQFEEIRNVFVYINMVIGLIGFLALITVSLGIVNTMVMAIMERRREIGVLKSLGADESEIKLLFLTESAVIGIVGAIAGVVFGWLITRVASFIAKGLMESKEIDPIELFTLPIWLILSALALGLLVSLAAGYYPASRAARVDPVQALRNE